ncbi:MAG TPA: hypothetical protein VEI97_08750, partial [bacterium]|nr:hypothetical protein [bacterium]
MKYTFPLALFTLLLSLARPCLAQLPTWQSAQIVHSTPGAGGIGDSHTQANAISPTGDTYYYYTSDAGIEIGGQTYTSNGGGHVVAHYDPAGNFSGVLVSGGPVLDIQTDEAGNVYVAGQIYPNVYLRIGNTPPIRALGRARGDFFLAKWNAAGTLQWIRHDAAQLLSTHIGIDTLGHVTLGGYFINMAVVNGDTLTTPASNPRLLVMQYDAAGSFRWAQSSTGQSVNHVSLAAAPNGTLFLAASVGNGPFTWGAATIPTGPPPGHTSCWLKLSSSGQLLAYRRFGYEPDHPKVASDKSGNCYLLAHQEQSPFALGNTSFPLPAAASQKALVLNLGPNGNPLWLQPVYLTGPGGHVAGADLCVTPVPAANARVYVGGSFGPQNDTLRCGALSLASPGSPVRGFLLSLDAPSGAPAWLISLRSDATNFFTAFTHVSANARGEVSVGARSAGDTTYFGTIALTRLPTVANPSVALSAKLLENYNQLQGTVFSDVNLNGLRDANEPGYPGVAVESNPGQYHFVSSHDGRYFAFLGLGTHTLSVPRPPRHHNVVPIGPATHTFSTYGNLTAGPDFAIQAIPNQQDLRIFLTPLRRARPGFQVPYRVTYHNIGTVAIPTGLVTMVPDTLLTYLSSSPPATQSGTTLTWPFTSL